MAVNKRTRYEVLKRDNYTCRYCREKYRAFSYMAGVLKRKMSDLFDKAREIFEEKD